MLTPVRTYQTLAIALSVASGAALHAQQPGPIEHVEVGRVLVDVRVTDEAGRVVSQLSAADFTVEIDGRPARVDRALWHGARADLPAAEQRAGRLVVFLVQRTFDRTISRRERDVVLLNKTFQLSKAIRDGLRPPDRMAVLTLDRHLTVSTDASAMFGPAFRQAAASTYTMAEALILVGGALQPLPGSKTLVVFGYGFGEPDALYRTLEEAAALPPLRDPRYEAATRSLTTARVSVVSVDVTDARRHVLETTLQDLADQTGGTYVRAYPFPDTAVRQMAQSLEGYYTLSIERPAGRPGPRRLEVRTGRGLRVAAPRTYVD